MSKNIDFYSAAKELQGERRKRVLKLDFEINNLKKDGFEETVDTLMIALEDISVTNSAISAVLRDKLQIIVSESAVRRWRIDNGILKG